MRKIPSNLENPLDDLLLDLSDKVSPTFYNLGFTPNWITTLSNITTILVIILLLKAQYIWAAFFVLVAYFFDCLDGHFARKYKMVSEFGDYYDHVSDLLKFTALIYTLYKINSDKFYRILPFIIIAGILTFVHCGCQELYYNSDESKTLDFSRYTCPANKDDKNDIQNKIKITRFFGFGTFNLVLVACIIYYEF